MPVGQLSTYTFSNQFGGSRSTTTHTLVAGVNRVFVLFADYGNAGSGVAAGPTTLPTFGGVTMSEITRPQGGTNVVQLIAYGTPISDGSSGDYALVTVKNSNTDLFHGCGILLSGTTLSGTSSLGTAGLSTGPFGYIAGPVVPFSANSDMVLGGFVSADNFDHTIDAEGNVVFSNVSIGGTTSANYSARLSVVTTQGDSSVSHRITPAGSTRCRMIGLIMPGLAGGGSSDTAGFIGSFSVASAAASSILTLPITRGGTTNEVAMVFLTVEDPPAVGSLRTTMLDGVPMSFLFRNDASLGTGPGDIKIQAFWQAVSGVGGSTITVAADTGTIGGVAIVMTGVNQTNPSTVSGIGNNSYGAGPMISAAVAASATTQVVIGFGGANFGASVVTVGSGETSIATLDYGTGGSTGDMCIVCSAKSGSGSVSFSETMTGLGRWRHGAVVINLDTVAPPVVPAAAFYVRRRAHSSDW